ncbi:cryptochrome/photolyase family protein [Gordonia rubripertincta]|uniref:Deoxyribodipyrimidine photo-lyase n=1 Tax=Gordonia rubripertincta TaxID=36822 RepID=A0ABT4N2M8_GORRU|nr:deoxyribodipyrimidine photo-lyase [Gordonia rubripertincta]MCZ4553523.1 deoxyribodipyrimidine photo-lyase [Gordonia rubripertincta]
MSEQPIVLWLRRDLRLSDLPPLLTAQGRQVLACFVLDPTLEASSGDRRLSFLYDSLRDVEDQLDGSLLVVRGEAEKVIPKIAKSVDAEAVHISADYSPYGTRRDDKVKKALGDVPLRAEGSPYAVAPGRVLKDDGERYRVFTPYFRKWREHGWRDPADTGVDSATWLKPGDVSGIRAIKIPKSKGELDIPAGERAAYARFAEFMADDISGYDDDRNRPDHASTSRMSAYLKFGNIHPRALLADLEDGEGKGRAAYIRELAFRDFYADVLHQRPDSSWWNLNKKFDAIEHDSGKDADADFDAWREGKTGFPIVDAGMRQLSGSGFMHNRLRMIVGSFLVKDLHLPWQRGAAWFLDQLTDGDMASNQHGWQWVAGCGTDAAPYFRVFNPTTQGKKFDPSGDYVRRWVPELREIKGAAVHEPGDARPDDYPEPIVDHKTERQVALDRYNSLS